MKFLLILENSSMKKNLKKEVTLIIMKKMKRVMIMKIKNMKKIITITIIRIIIIKRAKAIIINNIK